MIKNVLKYEDLLLIEEFLKENGLDSGNLSVVMNIETQERLDRINYDYFYKINNGNVKEKPNSVSEINIKIGNVEFKYNLLKQNDQNT